MGKNAMRYLRFLFAATIVLLLHGVSRADDWATFMHDNARSGVTTESPDLPLAQAWVYTPRHAPSPAWPAPPRADFFHGKKIIRHRVTYDHAFHTVSSAKSVFFGSSTDDAVRCLDTETGKTRWTFFTGGPIRLAPTLASGKVYVGSDDGFLYCLSAADGTLVWKLKPSPGDDHVIGNGRMISLHPIRTGIIIDGKTGYCFAGLFPTYGVHLYAFDPETGKQLWTRKTNRSPQGYMLASPTQLFSPTGRAKPVVFNRKNGRHVGDVPSPGGSRVVITKDVIVTGTGDAGSLTVSDVGTRKHIVSLDAMHFVNNGKVSFVHSPTELSSLDWSKYLPLAREKAGYEEPLSELKLLIRKRRRTASQKELEELKTKAADLTRQVKQTGAEMAKGGKWRVCCDYPHSLILAGNVLFVGGDDKVAGFASGSGRLLWSGPVHGKAHGLAFAGGKLFVSTDKGNIHCFSPGVAVAKAPATVTSRRVLDKEKPTHKGVADAIVKASGIRKGICLVLDCGDGQLAAEIAKQTELRVIGVERDATKVAAAREALRAAGLYGTRVTVHHLTSENLPYPPYFANLVVSASTTKINERPIVTTSEIVRVLRPGGGTFIRLAREKSLTNKPTISGWQIVLDGGVLMGMGTRPALEGVGEWTHGFADVGNTACSMDKRATAPLRLQWFGRPGPRPMIDRHHRNVPPLCKDGRLFIPGDEVVMAVDAYNGTPLWDLAIPDSRRLGAFLDCSNMAVDDKSLYVVAKDACHVFNVTDGRRSRQLVMPQMVSGEKSRWGYLARVDNLVVGSGRKAKAGYVTTSRSADMGFWGDAMSLVTSTYLFALEDESGKPAWTYKSGLIINTTITIGDGRVYFVESHSPLARRNARGRTPMKTFLPGPNFLVALDLKTGATAWKKPFSLENCRHVVYLSHSNGRLVLSGNRYLEKRLWYFVYGIDSSNGTTVWERSHATFRPGGGHGEQNRHPTIIGDTVYAWPRAYKLKSGEPVPNWKFSRRGHGCGNISASARALFWRGGNPQTRDVRTGKVTTINRATRPGCFINIIPASGMILIPEASSGCTCAFPIQTSLGYAPVDRKESNEGK